MLHWYECEFEILYAPFQSFFISHVISWNSVCKIFNVFPYALQSHLISVNSVSM